MPDYEVLEEAGELEQSPQRHRENKARKHIQKNISVCAGVRAQVEPVSALTALCTFGVFLVTKHPVGAFKLLPSYSNAECKRMKKLLKTCFNQGLSNKVMEGSGSSGASTAPCLISLKERKGTDSTADFLCRVQTLTHCINTPLSSSSATSIRKRPLSFSEVLPWCVQSADPSRSLRDETHLCGCSGFILEDTRQLLFYSFQFNCEMQLGICFVQLFMIFWGIFLFLICCLFSVRRQMQRDLLSKRFRLSQETLFQK